MSKKKFFVSSIISLLLLLAGLIYTVSKYINEKYVIDEILYYITNGANGTSEGLLGYWISENVVRFSIVMLVLFVPILLSFYINKTIEFRVLKKNVRFTFLPKTNRFRFLYSGMMVLLSIVMGFFLLGADQYIKRTFENSTFIEEHYVDGRNIAITFPEEKRNLIVIYLESMENTFIDKESGGGWNYTVIPELKNLALENLNFSDSDKIGGAYPVSNTGWTVAAMVATTSGIPLKIPIERNSYTTSDNFLEGAYTLGDILKKEGYNLKLMVGSDANFGGRTNYFKNHGDYEIYDYYSAIEEGKMTEEDKVWWGFDDTDLFTWAKNEVVELAADEEPFNFTLLTVNTHFPDGYLEEIADQQYETQYENVHALSSKQVNDFISWIKEQEFYENTTIVLLGDHLSMQDPAYYDGKIDPEYNRTIYNTFINSVAEPINAKNRLFSSLDMYPTILASMGVEVEGNRLGLGTNLFSAERTLVEQFGLNYVDAELSKNSHFYNQTILDDDYFELIKQAE
ncbi:LTA synthase family protein [Ureibacillus massiliensis]|uniref:LTA synthase family protein n=1 Tax=Ureibacillus massiliensis TaxID=292806 RepID=UPI000A73F2BD|nr:LTA synthase family protein [Ureibacillus massiliensis]